MFAQNKILSFWPRRKKTQTKTWPQHKIYCVSSGPVANLFCERFVSYAVLSLRFVCDFLCSQINNILFCVKKTLFLRLRKKSAKSICVHFFCAEHVLCFAFLLRRIYVLYMRFVCVRFAFFYAFFFFKCRSYLAVRGVNSTNLFESTHQYLLKLGLASTWSPEILKQNKAWICLWNPKQTKQSNAKYNKPKNTNKTKPKQTNKQHIPLRIP